ncbi:MAG: hypothetical protein II623_08965, partial [Paludibacteraceae bacterium]|nr:hypothetical protein [Paludibacteraceae bacterium]
AKLQKNEGIIGGWLQKNEGIIGGWLQKNEGIIGGWLQKNEGFVTYRNGRTCWGCPFLFYWVCLLAHPKTFL